MIFHCRHCENRASDSWQSIFVILSVSEISLNPRFNRDISFSCETSI
ncbi:hypothetical protein [Helicobacter sp. T3_23-1056]